MRYNSILHFILNHKIISNTVKKYWTGFSIQFSQKDDCLTKTKKHDNILCQVLYGNSFGDYGFEDDIESFVNQCLYDLSECLGRAKLEAQAHGCLGGTWGYGQEFKNEVFEMHPYWWGGCTCGFDKVNEEWSDQNKHVSRIDLYSEWTVENYHSPDCRTVIPNFKCVDLEICWYKYIGRGMSVNKKVTVKELRKIFQDCFDSLD